MTGSDSEPGVLSEDSDHESERGSEYSKESDKDVISLQEGGSDSDADESTQHQQLTAEELIAGAQAISSDEEGPHYSSNSQSRQLSDREEGEDVSPSSSPRKEPVEEEQEPPAKKQKSSSREDLEDGELTSDSEEEEQKDKETSPKSDQQKRDHPRIDFPRFSQNHVPQKRRRPEDYGICKFYLRGNCTWDRTCKYAHPVGAEKTLWLAECGLPDPSLSVPRFRKNTDEKTRSPKSRSPRNPINRVNSFERKRSNSRRSNGSQSSPRVKESPRASPISSNGSRSQSPEDRKKNSRRRSRSPSAISSDNSRPRSRRSRSRDSDASSPGRRRARSTSSESGSSRSRSGSPVNQRAETTLGALLSPDDRPQTRDEAIRRLFTKNPDNEPEVYKKRPRKSPTPESISDDGSDNESIPDPRSESPFPASAHV